MIVIDGVNYPNASVSIVTNGASVTPPPPVGPTPPPPVVTPPPPVPAGVQVVQVPWGSASRIRATFAPDGVVAFAITAPSTPAQCQAVVAQTTGGYADMLYALSDTPGDFTGLPFTLAKGNGGVSVDFWTAGATMPPPPMAGMDNYWVSVAGGAPLYLNVKNAPGNGVTENREVYCETKQHAA